MHELRLLAAEIAASTSTPEMVRKALLKVFLGIGLGQDGLQLSLLRGLFCHGLAGAR